MYSASFRSSSCKAGLVVVISLSAFLFMKNFIFPSFMKLNLAGYEIPGWKFFALRMLNIGFHSLLACRVSAKRSAVSLMGFPLWVTWPFLLAALRIFFLHFNPGKSDDYVLWRCSSWGVSLWCSLYFWIWMLACLARLKKFSWIISWRVFSNLVSLSQSLSGTPVKCTFGLFT